MRFDLVLDGKFYSVELGVGKVVTVMLDGKMFRAETRKSSEGLKVVLDGKEFLVRPDGSQVWIDGHRHGVEVRNLRRGRPSWSHSPGGAGDLGAGDSAEKRAGGEEMIHPPMPGTVVSIMVKEGDIVKEGSPVIELEAMKMQNEIVSHIEGVVKEIRVSEGDLVEPADVMVVIGH